MSKNVRQIQGILFGNTVQITTIILQNCSILSFLSIYHFGNLYLGLCHFSDCNFVSKIKLVSRWCHWYTITVLMPQSQTRKMSMNEYQFKYGYKSVLFYSSLRRKRVHQTCVFSSIYFLLIALYCWYFDHVLYHQFCVGYSRTIFGTEWLFVRESYNGSQWDPVIS